MVEEQGWRVPELLRRLQDILRPHPNHPYDGVRWNIGVLLGKIYCSDIEYPGFIERCNKRNPRVADIIMEIVPKLEFLKQGIAIGEPDMSKLTMESANVLNQGHSDVGAKIHDKGKNSMVDIKRPQIMRGKSVVEVLGQAPLARKPRKIDRSVSCVEYRFQSLHSNGEVHLTQQKPIIFIHVYANIPKVTSRGPQFMRGDSVSAVMGTTALPMPPERKTERSVSCNEFRLQSLNSNREVFFDNN